MSDFLRRAISLYLIASIGATLIPPPASGSVNAASYRVLCDSSLFTTQALMLRLTGARRQIDPQIGRLYGLSPLAEKYSAVPARIVEPKPAQELMLDIERDFRDHRPHADLRIVQWAYEQAKTIHGDTTYKHTKERLIDHAAGVARTATRRMQAPPLVVAAALLHTVGSDGVARLPENSSVSPSDRRRIVDLLKALEEYQKEPDRPAIILDQEDPSLVALLNRQIDVITDLADHMTSVDPKNKDDFNRVRAALYTLIVADDQESLSTITENSDKAFVEKTRTRAFLIDGPQSRRLLLGNVANSIYDEYYKIFNPNSRNKIQKEQRDAIGLSERDARAFINTTCQTMQRLINLNTIKGARVHGFENPYRSTHRDYWRRAQELSDTDRAGTLKIADLTNLLYLEIVVDGDEDVQRVRELVPGIGLPGRAPEGLAAFDDRWAGREDYAHSFSTVERKAEDGTTVTVEVRIMTKAAYTDYLSNRHASDDEEPWWHDDLEHAANNYAGRLLGITDHRWIMRYDEKDPPLQITGDLQADLAENLARLASVKKVRALFPVDVTGTFLSAQDFRDKDMSDFFLKAVEFPIGAIGADAVFSTTVNGTPAAYPRLFSATLVPTSDRLEETVRLRVKPREVQKETDLDLSERLPPTPILLPEGSGTLDLDDKADRQYIEEHATTARAKLLVKQLTRKERKDKFQTGRSQIVNAFGVDIPWRNNDQPLPNDFQWTFLAHGQDLSTVTEMVEAVGHGLLPIESLSKTFHTRFVKITSVLAHVQKIWVAILETSQSQVGFLAEVVDSLQSTGWLFSRQINVDAFKSTNEAILNLGLSDAPLNLQAANTAALNAALNKAVSKIHIKRSFLPWRSGRKERKVRSVLNFSAESLLNTAKTLASGNVDIRRIRYLGTTPQGFAEYEWTLDGPDVENKDKPSRDDLPAAIEQSLTFQTIKPQYLVDFDFKLKRLKDEKYRLTFTNDEVQLGILADVAAILTQQGWNISGYLRQRDRGAGRVTEMDIQLPDNRAPNLEDEQRLQKALETAIWRARGDNPPVKKGQFLSLRFSVKDRPGALSAVAKVLMDMKISIDSGNLASTIGDVAEFDFVIYGPRTITPDKLREELGKNVPLLSAEVSRRSVSKATAKRLNEVIASDLDRKNPKSIRGSAPRQFVELPSDFEPPVVTDRSDESEIWEASVDEAYIAQYFKARELMFRYSGYYPHGEPPKGDPAYGKVAHDPMRKSGAVRDTPYAVHALEVLNRYMNRYRGRDETFIFVALLHDVLEDGPKNVYTYYEKMFGENPEGVRLALKSRFGFRDSELPEPLTDLSDLKKKIMAAARKEIIAEFKSVFPMSNKRLIFFLELFDHSGSTFNKSIEALFDKDVADVLAVKAADQSVNLDTAFEARSLAKTLMKNIRYVFPAMVLDISRRTPTYWESRKDLMRTMIREFSKLDEATAIAELQKTLYEEGKIHERGESRLAANQKTLLSISQTLEWTKQYESYIVSPITPLASVTLIELREFQAGLRRLAKVLADDTSERLRQKEEREMSTTSEVVTGHSNILEAMPTGSSVWTSLRRSFLIALAGVQEGNHLAAAALLGLPVTGSAFNSKTGEGFVSVKVTHRWQAFAFLIADPFMSIVSAVVFGILGYMGFDSLEWTAIPVVLGSSLLSGMFATAATLGAVSDWTKMKNIATLNLTHPVQGRSDLDDFFSWKTSPRTQMAARNDISEETAIEIKRFIVNYFRRGPGRGLSRTDLPENFFKPILDVDKSKIDTNFLSDFKQLWGLAVQFKGSPDAKADAKDSINHIVRLLFHTLNDLRIRDKEALLLVLVLQFHKDSPNNVNNLTRQIRKILPEQYSTRLISSMSLLTPHDGETDTSREFVDRVQHDAPPQVEALMLADYATTLEDVLNTGERRDDWIFDVVRGPLLLVTDSKEPTRAYYRISRTLFLNKMIQVMLRKQSLANIESHRETLTHHGENPLPTSMEEFAQSAVAFQRWTRRPENAWIVNLPDLHTFIHSLISFANQNRPDKIFDSLIDLRDSDAVHSKQLFLSLPAPGIVVVDLSDFRKLGDMAAQGSMVLSAFRHRWPLASIVVLTSSPALFEGLENVRAYTSPDDIPNSDPVDLWFTESAKCSGASLAATITICGLRSYWPSEIASGHGPSWLYNRLTSVGLPPSDTPLFPTKKSGESVSKVFINFIAQTNFFSFEKSKYSWLQLINRLIESGYFVEINTTPDWANPVQSLWNHTGRSELVSVKTFKDTDGLVRHIRETTEAIITIDTGVFHVARLFGVPSVTITTDFSNGWVPVDGLTFSTIPVEDFISEPISALHDLLKLFYRTSVLAIEGSTGNQEPHAEDNAIRTAA